MPRATVIRHVALALAVAAAVSAGWAATASAARLVGGTRQAAIRRAFTAHHRARVVSSIRVSTVDGSWSVVKSVSPRRRPGSARRVRRPRVTATFFHRVAGRERQGQPPGDVRADLEHRFTVVVTYTGSGSESITDAQHTLGVCAGQGGFNDTETVTISPMQWTVRYVVAPDDLLSATRARGGAVLVPRVTFGTSGSSVHAVERLGRTIVDTSCAGKTTRFHCTRTFSLEPGTSLASVSRTGLQVGVPMRSTSSGQCAESSYTLGSTLWTDGATTAVARRLHLVGGTMPTAPYRTIPLAWPGNAVPDLAASPCTGDVDCHDTFAWTGSVTVSPGAGG